MNWLFFGFLAAWVIHLAYLLSLTLRQRRLNHELETLRKLVQADKPR